MQAGRAETMRKGAALFLVAFGFALLSVCLFRILSFKASSTPFFMLYVGLGMPIGAYLAKRRAVSPTTSFGSVIRALIWFPFVFLIIPPLVSLGPDALMDFWYGVGENAPRAFLLQIAYLTLVTAPFFVFWGAAELIGYEVALETKGIRHFFYLIFVWALALALAFGYFAIPALGWLRTVAIVPLTSLLALSIWSPSLAQTGRWGPTRRSALAAALLVVLASIGYAERPFILAATPVGPFTVKGQLERRGPPQPGTAEPSRAKLLDMFWGEHIHFSLIQEADEGHFVGVYDGMYMWPTAGGVSRALDLALYTVGLPKNPEVCIIGAGGGRQVVDALNAGAKRVVAVDLASEVLEALKGEYSWVNGHVYLDPRVETYGMDGRSYITKTAADDDLFDVITFPFTENVPSVLRAVFESGHTIHSVEAFRDMARHLKPGGRLIVIKGIDRGGRISGNYAASMKAAGLYTYGFFPPQESPAKIDLIPAVVSPFVLVGAKQAIQPAVLQEMHDFLGRPHTIVDFQSTRSVGTPIYFDSPWIYGALGVLIDQTLVATVVWTIAGLALLLTLLVTLVNVRRRIDGERRSDSLFLTLAGVAIGVNAVCLENGVIFWLVNGLLNPLAAFFVGAACFLFIWGCASFVLRWWYVLVGLGVAGTALALGTDHWTSMTGLAGLSLMVLCGGFCFPLVAVRFRGRLLDLFIADAVGGLVGGLLGIWLPVLFGFKTFFGVVPVLSLACLAAVVVAVTYGRRGVIQP
jgi:SAM-dependent methyltransferase